MNGYGHVVCCYRRPHTVNKPVRKGTSVFRVLQWEHQPHTPFRSNLMSPSWSCFAFSWRQHPVEDNIHSGRPPSCSDETHCGSKWPWIFIADLKTQPVTSRWDLAVVTHPRGAFAAAWRSGSRGFQVGGLAGVFSDSRDLRRTPQLQMWWSWTDMWLEAFLNSTHLPRSFSLTKRVRYSHGHRKQSMSSGKHQQPVAESHEAVRNINRAENSVRGVWPTPKVNLVDPLDFVWVIRGKQQKSTAKRISTLQIPEDWFHQTSLSQNSDVWGGEEANVDVLTSTTMLLVKGAATLTPRKTQLLSKNWTNFFTRAQRR